MLARVSTDPDLPFICDDHDRQCLGVPETPWYDHTWPDCPLAVVRHPAWRYLCRLDALIDAAPIVGWPDSYAAWLVDGVLALRQIRVERQIENLEKARRAGR